MSSGVLEIPHRDLVPARPETGLVKREATTEAHAKAEVVFPPSVSFRVTRRITKEVMEEAFNFWQRVGYEYFCRRAKGKWRIPPLLPVERGNFEDFDDADKACTSADDQLHLTPFNWAFSGDIFNDPEFVCRPRDTTDPANVANYERLKSYYGGGSRPNVLNEIQRRIGRVERRLSTLEEEDERRESSVDPLT